MALFLHSALWCYSLKNNDVFAYLCCAVMLFHIYVVNLSGADFNPAMLHLPFPGMIASQYK